MNETKGYRRNQKLQLDQLDVMLIGNKNIVGFYTYNTDYRRTDEFFFNNFGWSRWKTRTWTILSAILQPLTVDANDKLVLH